MPPAWASGQGRGWAAGPPGSPLSVCLRGFLEIQRRHPSHFCACEVFSALIIFIISLTPSQSLITLISLKCGDEVSDGCAAAFNCT